MKNIGVSSRTLINVLKSGENIIEKFDEVFKIYFQSSLSKHNTRILKCCWNGTRILEEWDKIGM